VSLNTNPRTWTTGEIATAAMLNQEIRDAIAGIQAAWQAWTPTLAGITLGNGSLSARTHRIGKTIFCDAAFTAGSTSAFTAGATLRMTLPVTPSSRYGVGYPIGHAFFLDSSGASASRSGGSVLVDPSLPGVFFLADRLAPGTVTDTVPWTWAAGDQLYWSAQYEAA
jgi:hypothetical protein